MNLNSDQLDAFYEVCRLGSFSKAAKVLSVSQPALSQRVSKLEDQLGTTLLIRNGHHAEVTEAGQQLLLLCRSRRVQDEDFFRSLGQDRKGELSGIIRIAAYSSIARSLIVPRLSTLLKSSPHLRLEFLVRELYELPAALKKLQADFVLTEQPISLAGVVSTRIGEEEYVLVEAVQRASGKTGSERLTRFFDHDPEDQTTFNFWKKQKTTPGKIERAFVDEIYMIMDCVEQGLGVAVLPRHLVEERPKLRIRKGLKPMRVPVFLNYFEQPYYSPLHQAVLNGLIKGL